MTTNTKRSDTAVESSARKPAKKSTRRVTAKKSTKARVKKPTLSARELKRREAEQQKMNQPHNTYFVEVFKVVAFAVSFLRFVLKPKKILDLLDLDKLTVESRSFYDRRIFRESFPDMVYSIPMKDPSMPPVKTFVLMEHKSYNDRFTIFQIAYYAMQIMFQDYCQARRNHTADKHYKLPLVLPILIHHGNKRFSGPLKLQSLYPAIGSITRYLLHFQVILVDLNRYNFEDLPQDPNDWKLNIVLSVMKLIHQKENQLGVEECFRKLKPHIIDDPVQLEFARLTIKYFIDASNVDPFWFDDMIEENYPEESEVTNMLTTRERLMQKVRSESERLGEERGIKLGEERGIRLGEVIGEERGIRLGEERGMNSFRETMRNSIIDTLTDRFGFVPEDLQRMIFQPCDANSLCQMVSSAAVCPSLNDFRESL